MADSLIRMQFEESETNLEKLPTQASVSINQSDAEQQRRRVRMQIAALFP